MLYIECKMGAAGDMLTAALLELLPEDKQAEALKTLQNLGIDGVEFSVEKTQKCGIQGSYVHVHVNGVEEEVHDHHHGHEHSHEEHVHHHHHEHHKLSDVLAVISKLNVNDKVKNDAVAVYNLIAEAESHAHGVPVDQIHFHEVGNKDAIMDVTAVCYLMDLLGEDKVMASPVHVGSGSVHCAHGIMPVPAPATEFLLRGIPYYQGDIKSELCTPTGAALLKYFAGDYGPQPMMKIEKTGVGCGKKDFETANCVRIFKGEIETVTSIGGDKIIELDANIDDMTAEEIGFAMDCLFDAGAREVFAQSVYMKKNRPGTLITVICSEDKKDEIVKSFFKHTTTIGIRQKICDRYILNRQMSVVKTPFGDIRKKTSTGYETSKEKLEFDDLAKIALEKNMSLREVRALAEKE